MENFEKKFVPIEFKSEDEAFEPEKELAEIKNQVRRAPIYEQSNFRRELIKKWKEKFINQRLGLAAIQNEIEEKIRLNPDIEFRYLWQIVKDRGQEYQLSERQYQNFEKAIATYLEKHQAIAEEIKFYQEQYKENWQKEFFKDLFGQYPQGKIDLEILPMNLFWKCHDVHDFALIYRGDSEDIKDLNISGCAVKGKIEKIKYLISAANLSMKRSEREVAATGRHEEKHIVSREIFRKFLPAISDFELKIDWHKWQLILPSKRDQIIQETIYQFLENLRQNYIRQRAKEEILSYYIGDQGLNDIYKHLRRSENYNYFKNFPVEIEKNLKKLLGPLYQTDYQKMTKQIVKKVKEFYGQDLDGALDAIFELEKLPEFQKNRQKLVAFLSTEPLHKWQRLAKMLKE